MIEEKYLQLLKTTEEMREDVARELVQSMLKMGHISATQEMQDDLGVITKISNIIFDRLKADITEDNQRHVNVCGQDFYFPIPEGMEVNKEEEKTIDKPVENIIEETLSDNTDESVEPVTLENEFPEEEIEDEPEEEIIMPSTIVTEEQLKQEQIQEDIEIEEENLYEMTETNLYQNEEKRKAVSELLFDTYRINATHFGTSSSSEMFVYVAPLTNELNGSNVPIIVHIYTHGAFVTASSYDSRKEGKNIVTVEIDDFYLLIRGSMSNGIFSSSVLTTGISANAGDTIEVITKSSGAQHRVEGSGHIKFHNEEDIVEIFPMSSDNEYLVINRNSEFIDYFVVAKNYGNKKITLYRDSESTELIAGWDDGFFEAELL